MSAGGREDYLQNPVQRYLAFWDWHIWLRFPHRYGHRIDKPLQGHSRWCFPVVLSAAVAWESFPPPLLPADLSCFVKVLQFVCVWQSQFPISLAICFNSFCRSPTSWYGYINSRIIISPNSNFFISLKHHIITKKWRQFGLCEYCNWETSRNLGEMVKVTRVLKVFVKQDKTWI